MSWISMQSCLSIVIPIKQLLDYTTSAYCDKHFRISPLHPSPHIHAAILVSSTILLWSTYRCAPPVLSASSQSLGESESVGVAPSLFHLQHTHKNTFVNVNVVFVII
jgi:hypothetical protein